MGLLRELQFALRRWRGRPVVAVTASLTLALGIGATTAVFSIVDTVFLRPLPYPQADRLVTVWNTFPHWRENPALGGGWDRVALSWPEYLDLRAGASTLEDIALSGDHTAILSEGVAEQVRGTIATASFFKLLGAAPLLGRGFESREDVSPARVIVLSHDLWRRRYGGDPSIVGRTIRLDDQPYLVVGVLEPSFRFGQRAQYWIPFGAVPDRLDRGDHGFAATARMRAGVTMDDVLREAEPLLRAGESPSLKGAAVAPPFDRAGRQARPLLLLLSACAAILLLIACANVAGLLFGEAVWRRREMTVRSALGASQWRLMRQLLVESAALALMGTVAGIVVAHLLTNLMLVRAPAELANLEDVAVNTRALVFASLVMLGTTLLCGCGPGLALARRAEAKHLHDGGRTSTGSRRTQSTFVVAEIALTMAVLFVAGLLVTTVSRLDDVNPGFTRQNVLTVSVVPPSWRLADPASRRVFDQAVLERISGLSGVVSAAWVGPLAFSGRAASNVIQIAGFDTAAGAKPVAETRAITPNYFSTMSIPVLRGRAFEDADRESAPRVAVVSSLFEKRYTSGESAIGLRFRWQGDWWTVVGVVADVRHEGLEAAERATFYVPVAQKPGRANQLVLRTEMSPASLGPAVAAAIRQVDPSVVIQEVVTMDRLIDGTLGDERYRATLVGAFAVFAALLAGVGLYGTIARSVNDRRREIGVRLALGAAPADVLRLVLRQGGVLVLGGVALGLVAAVSSGHAMQSMIFLVSWFEPAILCAVIGLVTLVASASIIGPARRASRVDPILVLRD